MGNDTVVTVKNAIEGILKNKDIALVAIDGRCASGKTTLSAELKELLDCEVIHMDHFYPRLVQRTAARFSEPGGNLDRERVLMEVIAPIMRREEFSYRPYDPKRHDFSEPIKIKQSKIIIMEGSYSCHPELFDFYDLRIFMTVKMPERLQRIKKRDGEQGLAQFKELWIPKEELYFSTFNIEERCDLRFSTD